jgi:heptosyltransferase-2
MTATGAAVGEAGEAPTSIIVRTPNWLGDLLLSTAFLQAVLARFPDATLDLIVREGFQVLPLPHRGRILTFDKGAQGAGGFGKGLRGKGYSHFFVLPPSFSSAWMAFRSRVPHRIGYGGGGRSWLLRPALPYRHAHRSTHLTLEYLALLDPWGGNDGAQGFRPRLEMTEGWIERFLPAAAAGPEPYVILAPGAEFGPAKQWPVAHYADLARSLCKRGLKVVVTGLAKDHEAARQILAGCPGGINLCGATDLPAVVALVARAALLVSNDSGAMHMGAALGRPQIALFGSSNPAWTGPLNPQSEVIHLGLECSPCYKRVCPLGHTNCLVDIRPETVLERSLGLLERGNGA